MKIFNLLLISAFLFTANVFARHGEGTGSRMGDCMGSGDPDMQMGRHHEGMEKHMEKMMDELKLNDEQKEKITQINLDYRKKMDSFRKEMETTMEATRTEIEKEKSDETTLNSLKEKHKKVMSEMIDNRIQHILDIKKELSSEQFEELSTKMKKGLMGKMGTHKKMTRKMKKEMNK